MRVVATARVGQLLAVAIAKMLPYFCFKKISRYSLASVAGYASELEARVAS